MCESRSGVLLFILTIIPVRLCRLKARILTNLDLAKPYFSILCLAINQQSHVPLIYDRNLEVCLVIFVIHHLLPFISPGLNFFQKELVFVKLISHHVRRSQAMLF